MAFDAKEKQELARSIISDDDYEEGSDEEFGTSASGYIPARCGPVRCSHCVHYPRPERCSHPDVVTDSQMKTTSDGLAIVEPGGCCRYFRPKGKEARI